LKKRLRNGSRIPRAAPNGKNGRPSLNPSAEQRQDVEMLIGAGLTHTDVCQFLGGISTATLYKTFPREVASGVAKLKAKAVDAQVRNLNAKDGWLSQRASEFILARRFKWSERTESANLNANFDANDSPSLLEKMADFMADEERRHPGISALRERHQREIAEFEKRVSKMTPPAEPGPEPQEPQERAPRPPLALPPPPRYRERHRTPPTGSHDAIEGELLPAEDDAPPRGVLSFKKRSALDEVEEIEAETSAAFRPGRNGGNGEL